MWYCKIVDGAINCFANSDNVAIGDDMIRLPEGLDPNMAMLVVDDDGTFSLTTDPTKLAQKTADQWTQVRAQQRQKLYESDWTCSVTDYEVPNKPEWVQYRAQLRDVTLQSDPFAIVWPEKPGQEVVEPQ